MYYPRSYPPPAPPAPPRTFTIIALSVVAFLFLGVIGTFGTCAYVAHSAMTVPDDRVGVLTGAQLPDDIVQTLQKQGSLAHGEELLAYYDCTVGRDGTEVAFVTPERVVHVKNKKLTDIALSAVAKVRLVDAGVLGHEVHVQATTGKTLKIEIAPLNGGVLFANTLEGAWQQKKPGAVVERVPR